MISARQLGKEYSVHRRPPGLWAALRSVLHRRYDTVRAVTDVSFEISAGERVGLLGANGAGKTTILKMLSGLLVPTSGEIQVDGLVPSRRQEAFLKSIALVLGQRQQLLWDLPAVETFELNRTLYDVSPADYQATVAELTELLELGEISRRPVRQLSLGERMRCELAAALIHQPRVLFLDEPTIGLDVSMQAAIRGFIRRYNELHGATLVMTSHYMDDVLALCPRVLVIHDGVLAYDGPLDTLAHQVRPEKRIVVSLSTPVTAQELEAIGKLVHHEPLRATLQIQRGELHDAMARLLARLPVQDLTVEDPPLEEVMAELFSKRHGPDGASQGGTRDGDAHAPAHTREGAS